MVRHDGEYYADPMNVSERFIRLVALHDNVKDPSAVTLKSSFDQLHLNSLDISEILLAAEREFDLEISDDDCESFHSVNDVVEFLVRNFHTK
ncbi:acyl carrier protein [Stylonychia lemnae]|uniref:Acyl carrier protein n=1 Tax=Stylonychia lemnae TaxID=5949 RepID=A0A077ZSU6_STYLE|nr:acyl carrier protein [Stylonychia lemnae]|eukprot:CDW72957.1 acyl carrier protein [Stylonychia lemnae]